MFTNKRVVSGHSFIYIKEEKMKAKNPVKITDTTLRDGHQSIFATRMRTEDMLPICD